MCVIDRTSELMVCRGQKRRVLANPNARDLGGDGFEVAAILDGTSATCPRYLAVRGPREQRMQALARRAKLYAHRAWPSRQQLWQAQTGDNASDPARRNSRPKVESHESLARGRSLRLPANMPKEDRASLREQTFSAGDRLLCVSTTTAAGAIEGRPLASPLRRVRAARDARRRCVRRCVAVRLVT